MKPYPRPMNVSRVAAAAVAGWFFAATAVAQVTATTAKDDIIHLSPFEVAAEIDHGSSASSTLAGTLSGSSSRGSFTDFSGGMRRPQRETRVRGIGAADQTCDYFLTDAPLDGNNLDRVELNRGPNAMLFGLGRSAGIVNRGLIKAQTNRDKTKEEVQFGQEASARLGLDHNQVLAKDVVALRMASLVGDRRFLTTSCEF